MTDARFPFIRFSQYGSDSPSDDLLLFAAPARVLAAWAGIPRKAWHIRMLFQRPITPGREADLKRFWDTAGAGGANGFILGPTAIVVAIQEEPNVIEGQLDLAFEPFVDLESDPSQILPRLADRLYPSTLGRLSEDQRRALADFEATPFAEFPEIEHDYVFEFALQLTQMRLDPARFVEINGINREQLIEIVLSMESLCRPAIVVDGQHRLWGAASSNMEIMLPVVGIPHCSWTDQIYQFVVINETAQKVETSLLTDIFGSSLTRIEQDEVRRKLAQSRVDVEGRIAAVVASRDPESPFFNMIQLRIEGTAPVDYRPYLSERTIRVLIDGSTQRHSRGWRSDDEFFDEFVAPTFPAREDWESWTDGYWREYWIAFWSLVRDFYNDQAREIGREPLWQPNVQSNLTKAVTLRQMQSLFMTKCVERMKEIDATVGILTETLGEEEAKDKIDHLRRDRAIADDIDQFRDFVHDFFLERGVPVRVFLTRWKTSLDDAEGQLELWETLETAFERNRKGERFTVKGRIFVPSDDA